MHYLFFLFSILLSSVCTTVWANDIDETINKAKQAQLAHSPTWLALLHYKLDVSSGQYLSEADGDDFFLSASGKSDPVKELVADITAFVSPKPLNNAQCRFPARWFWLKQTLNLSSEKYDVSCPKLQDWMAKASSDQLTLVFPAMYLNNPGSMFGHTFIRFDDSKKSNLLSYTLNYAAKANPGDGMLAYVYNGLSGGYNGRFAIRPYYETVQLYSDIENRDIWEYELDYSEQEIAQLLRHVWEVTGIQFDYYFLDENCSYRLLALLDAVKPEAQLSSTDTFPLYVIPVDTVRALDDKGLILTRKFRASLTTQIERNAHVLSPQSLEIADLLLEHKIDFAQFEQKVSNQAQRTRVLEYVYSLLQFRKQSGTSFASTVLSQRSKLPETLKLQYTDVPPETGHASVLAAIGIGKVRGNNNIRLQLRPAFHSLLDNPIGYVSGAEIIGLDTELNWLLKPQKLELEKLIFFNVISLNPIKSWDKPLSWKLKIALERTALNINNSTLAFITSGGAGVSFKKAKVTFFALADVEVNISKKYLDEYSILMGWTGGLSYPLGFGQLKISYQNVDSVSGENLERIYSSVDMQVNINKNTSVYLGYDKKNYQFFNVDEWLIGLNVYF